MKRKMKTTIWIAVMILMGTIPLSVSAAETGSIRVELPKELSGATVCCLAEEEEELAIQADEQGVAVLSNLQAGEYRIQVLETNGYEFTEAQVRVPMWDEVEKKMSYDITVIPKYSRVTVTTSPSPQTGDRQPVLMYALMGGSSLALLGIWFHCRKRKP